MSTKKVVHCAMYLVFGIILPTAFHSIKLAGNVFLPMHIPVLLCGFGLGPAAGLLVGVFTPLLSSLLTGMPPILPALPLMMGELATYGLSVGLCYRKYDLGVYKSLYISLLLGRCVSIGISYILTIALQWKVPLMTFCTSLFIYGLPGILLQIIIIPLLVKRMEKAKFMHN